MKTLLLMAGVCFFILPISHIANAQEFPKTDTTTLDDVVITAHPSRPTFLEMTGSLNLIKPKEFIQQPNYSLVQTMNTNAGVRMEERSPGSYRLSIRGSLIRSPFGVRNVKIYFDDIPLTDATGNTYLNALDPSVLHSAQIIKGPEGSLFGANTGGVLNLYSFQKDTSAYLLKASLSGGTFGLFKENTSIKKRGKYLEAGFYQGYQTSEGYRENSRLKRIYLQGFTKWNPVENYSLKLNTFYSGINYQTPGGLNSKQYEESPSSARPGAIEQKAGIENNNFVIGLTQEIVIVKNLKNHSTAFANLNRFTNPFISNYEVRKENNGGFRSYFNYINSFNNNLKINLSLGAEFQKTKFFISNHKNEKGIKDSLWYADDIEASQGIAFTNLKFSIFNRLHIESGVSINFLTYLFERNYPMVSGKLKQKFSNEWMPKVGISYLLKEYLALRISCSRGFSPPTHLEVRPSDIVYNALLKAETGTNYEGGIRIGTKDKRFTADLSYFDFHLKNAIVKRTSGDDKEFYINAGRTKQKGVEAESTYLILKKDNDQFLNDVSIKGSFTYYHFTFSDYKINDQDFSGKMLTGVPAFSGALTVSLNIYSRFNLLANYFYNDRVPLNDNNTSFATSFHLIQTKINYALIEKNEKRLFVFFGGDNLLNQKYSLGNDLNAFANRYFNTATPINFYLGLSVYL